MNEIHGKMIDIMKEIGPVGKDQKNAAQGYAFRGIDQFTKAFHPALIRHGVYIVPRVTSVVRDLKDVTRGNGKAGIDKHVDLLVEFDFVAKDGSKVTLGPVASEGLDSGDKATNKAMTGALKNVLWTSFCIPTEDVDEADRDSPEIQRNAKSDRPQPPPTKAEMVHKGEAVLKKMEANLIAAAGKALDASVTGEITDISNCDFVLPMGQSKGMSALVAPSDDLHYFLGQCVKSIDDPKKANFKLKNIETKTKIETILAYRAQKLPSQEVPF